MTTHAYSQLYLAKSSRAIGNMLHNAVLEYEMDGHDFWARFIQSDIGKSYEVLDKHFDNNECKLKTVRKHRELTQEELSLASNVSLNTIRAYERKSKDLNKARIDIVINLAKALKCDVIELLD